MSLAKSAFHQCTSFMLHWSLQANVGCAVCDLLRENSTLSMGLKRSSWSSLLWSVSLETRGQKTGGLVDLAIWVHLDMKPLSSMAKTRRHQAYPGSTRAKVGGSVFLQDPQMQHTYMDTHTYHAHTHTCYLGVQFSVSSSAVLNTKITSYTKNWKPWSPIISLKLHAVSTNHTLCSLSLCSFLGSSWKH